MHISKVVVSEEGNQIKKHFVHRDVKPLNIFLCNSSHDSACPYEVKIGDFGIFISCKFQYFKSNLFN